MLEVHFVYLLMTAAAATTTATTGFYNKSGGQNGSKMRLSRVAKRLRQGLVVFSIVVLLFYVRFFYLQPLRAIEVLFNFGPTGNHNEELSDGEIKEMESIFLARKELLEKVCQLKGWSENDPIPTKEDNELGELYHLPEFNTFACL